jgi:hypothetical protein
MRRYVLLLAIAGAIGAGVWAVTHEEVQFEMGGAMINLGYRLQDPVARYDFAHEHGGPPEIWEQFLKQNHMASSVRQRWPRTNRHPVIALVTCMDGRLDTNEIAGDTRRYYYVLRLAGSVLAAKEEEMLELAVNNGVEVVVFTTHTDCAAEKASRNAAQRALYPNLVQAIDERESRFREFLGRPVIREKIEQGHLLVKWMDLDTSNELLGPHPSKAEAVIPAMEGAEAGRVY